LPAGWQIAAINCDAPAGAAPQALWRKNQKQRRNLFRRCLHFFRRRPGASRHVVWLL